MVTIIIPCYNGEEVIDRSVESVYIQDYSNIELIVVDDGSTDRSKEHILSWKEKFIQKGFVLRYVYQENRGLGGAIDTGLKYVTGKYLSLLDADDYFLQGSVSKKARFLDEHNDYAGVRTSGYELRGNNKQLFNESDDNKKNTDYFYALLFNDALNWAGSYMVRTDILFSVYPDRNIYPSRFGQNMQILLPTAYNRKFGYIDEPLMVYVIQQDSHSHAADIVEQRKKKHINFYGYLDIYTHVIQTVIKDPEERKIYDNQFDVWKYRHECDEALLDNNKETLSETLKEWRKIRKLTLNEKIKYYQCLNPVKAIMLKVLRRINHNISRMHGSGIKSNK